MARFDWHGEIPGFALRRDDSAAPTWHGAPQFYRCDRAEGGWYVGTDFQGEELTGQIFAYRWETGERWGRPRQSWLDLALVDSFGTVSATALNKDSALNVFAWIESLKQTNNTRVDVAALRVTLGFRKVPVRVPEGPEGEEFYAVEVRAWEFVAPNEFLQVDVFRASGLFEWVLPGEV